jgi:hypothetical protein
MGQSRKSRTRKTLTSSELIYLMRWVIGSPTRHQ